MEFIYNGLVYSQRTPNSKFVCSDLEGNILKKFSPEELPYEIYVEYTYVKMQKENPAMFFMLKDGLKKDTKEIIGFAHKVHNLIIPEFIDGKQIYDIDYELKSLEGIESVSIPNNFRRYPTALFSASPNMIKAYVGDFCEISSGAFSNKEKLVEVRIPETISAIESSCFYGCKSLKKINLKNIIEFGDNSFSHCESLDFDIRKNAIRIGTKAFFKSGITKLDLEATVIENAAFAMCKDLKEINIQSKEISKTAFADCNISKINIEFPTVTADELSL